MRFASYLLHAWLLQGICLRVLKGGQFLRLCRKNREIKRPKRETILWSNHETDPIKEELNTVFLRVSAHLSFFSFRVICYCFVFFILKIMYCNWNSFCALFYAQYILLSKYSVHFSTNSSFFTQSVTHCISTSQSRVYEELWRTTQVY